MCKSNIENYSFSQFPIIFVPKPFNKCRLKYRQVRKAAYHLDKTKHKEDHSEDNIIVTLDKSILYLR